MNSPLQIVTGLTVTESEAVHDYVQIAFGDEIGISIYNEMSITPRSISIDKQVGKIVASVLERENAIEIEFIGGTQIAIDLRPEAYRGPEALELYRQGHPLVIWN